MVPPELKKLSLYAQDEKLCKQWPDLLSAWQVAYPGVDISAEVAKAHAWEVANPERQKIRRGRFLTNWLSRAQDRGCRGFPSRNVPPPPSSRDLLIRELEQYRDVAISWCGYSWVIAREGIWQHGQGFKTWSMIAEADLQSLLKLAKEVHIAHDLECRVQEDGEA